MQTVHGGVGTATCKRMIWNFELSNTEEPPTTGQEIAIGIAVVGEDVAVTGGALPDPLSEFNKDWYYWVHKVLTVIGTGAKLFLEWEVIIKTMRRLRGGQRLIIVTETPLATDEMTLNASVRMLWSQQA